MHAKPESYPFGQPVASNRNSLQCDEDGAAGAICRVAGYCVIAMTSLPPSHDERSYPCRNVFVTESIRRIRYQFTGRLNRIGSESPTE